MGRHRRSAAGRAEPAEPAPQNPRQDAQPHEDGPRGTARAPYGAGAAPYEQSWYGAAARQEPGTAPCPSPQQPAPPAGGRGHGYAGQGASWQHDAALFDGMDARRGRAAAGHEAAAPRGAGPGGAGPGSPSPFGGMYDVTDVTPEHTYAPTASAPSSSHGHEGPASGHRRKKRGRAPVRTGLLGVSAAVALGAVAVGTGVIPGGGYSFGGGHDAKVRAADSPTDAAPGGTAEAADRGTPSASRGSDRSKTPAPSKSAGKKSAQAKEAPSVAPSAKAPASSGQGEAGTSGKSGPGTRSESAAPKQSSAPAPSAPAVRAPVEAAKPTGDESAASAAVLSLVNQERAKAGCSPVTADSQLASLAAGFSRDMAARDFFDHTDPDGDTPWDRADDAGVDNLGGENIARGQADAASVMKSWMNSPGHRANILNCDYTTLGVGVHFGSGGPWWTQDFGF